MFNVFINRFLAKGVGIMGNVDGMFLAVLGMILPIIDISSVFY
jgi:hypothetical protein